MEEQFDRMNSQLDRANKTMKEIIAMLWSLMTPEQRRAYELSCQEPVPKHLSQELIKNQNEREEVLEEVVPKHKKRKSNRRKKIPSRLKGNSRLKRIKIVRKKVTPRLKRKPNKRGRKARTGMKAGTKKKQESSKRKEMAEIEVVKKIEMKVHGSYLDWVQESRNCFKLYQRCEVYKARVKPEEGMGMLSQQNKRIFGLVTSIRSKRSKHVLQVSSLNIEHASKKSYPRIVRNQLELNLEDEIGLKGEELSRPQSDLGAIEFDFEKSTFELEKEGGVVRQVRELGSVPFKLLELRLGPSLEFLTGHAEEKCHYGLVPFR